MDRNPRTTSGQNLLKFGLGKPGNHGAEHARKLVVQVEDEAYQMGVEAGIKAHQESLDALAQIRAVKEAAADVP